MDKKPPEKKLFRFGELTDDDFVTNFKCEENLPET